MALQTLPGGVLLPTPPVAALTINPGAGLFSSFLIDASGEKLAVQFSVPKDGNIAKAAFLLGTVTQAPVNGLTVSLQDIDLVTGDPDGTQDQTFAVAQAAIVTDAWIEGTFGAVRAVQAGEHIALVVEFTTFATGDSLNINNLTGATRSLFMHSSHVDHFTAAWAKSISANPILYIEYDDGSTAHIPGCFPFKASANQTISNATDPDEVGIRISLPFPCRAIGMWAMVSISNGADFDLVFYEGTTAQRSLPAVFDEDIGTESGFAGVVCMFDPFTLVANTEYIAAVKGGAGSTVTIVGIEVAAAKNLDAWSAGQPARQMTRVDLGAWTATTTKRPTIGIIIDQFSDGVGGGGNTILAGSGIGLVAGI